MSTFDDMQAVWQTAADPPPRIDPSRLAELRREAERFDRAIRWRDRREFAAVGLLVAIAVWMFPEAPSVVRGGLVLMVAGGLFAAGWLWRAQRRVPPPAPDLPAAEALRQSLARVEVQIGLLRSVHRWYLAPLAVGPLVMAAGVVGAAAREIPADAPWLVLVLVVASALAGVAFAGGMFYVIYRLNQRAVRRELEPLRARLASLLDALTDDNLPTDA